MAGKKQQQVKPASNSEKLLEIQVKKWIKKAPEIRGLRRPGVRMRAAAMLQRLESSGVSEVSTIADMDISEMAAAVADVDELLAVVGGAAYTEWIEQISDTTVQISVLMEFFSSIYGDLGKDLTSPS